MSVESITWALKVPVPASSAKFVLVVLANQANDETGLAFPSIAYLAEATGQDRKTVISNLGKLLEWGLIEDSGRRVGATKQIIAYKLLKSADLFEEQSQKRNSSKRGTVPKTTGKSTVFPSEQSQKRDTEPSLNHIEPKAKTLVRQAGRFDEFWALYPNKTGKKPCQTKWLKRGLDALADQIIADVRLRKAEDRRWLEGFVPNPETYLNQDRWDDEIQRRQPARAGPNGTPGKQMQGIMALEGLKSGNRLDAGRDRDGAAEALPALVGPNTGR